MSPPSTWAKARLRELAEVITKGTTPTTLGFQYQENGIPFIKVENLVNGRIDHTTVSDFINEEAHKKLTRSQLRAGDVLVSIAGTIGRTAAVTSEDGQANTNQAVGIIRGVDRIFGPKYLRYFFESPQSQSQLQPAARGGAMNNISLTDLGNVETLIAPFGEQGRIVAEIEKQFTRLDDAVAALKRVQANLKHYRASVLKAACEGRLVPTEAELARKEGRHYEPASELLKRILADRRAKWEADQLQKMIAAGKSPKDAEWKKKYKQPQPPETSALPQLPEGWVWASVEQLSTKVVDGVHKKPDYVPTGIPFVTVKNLTAGPGISFSDLNYVTPADHEEFIKRANPERGDILVSKDGTLGVIRAIRSDEVFSIFVSVALIKPVLNELTDYFEQALSSPQVQIQMVPKGSGLQHIHLEDLRQDCIPMPPLEEQGRIVTAAARHLSIIDSLEIEAEKRFLQARALRNSILHSAFSGKLVPQDPNDEPASVLLEQIRAARAQEPKDKTPKATNGASPVNGKCRRRVGKLAQRVSAGKG